MIIYKVVNDRNNTIVEYHLKRDKALRSLKDIQVWFTDSYHIESEIVEDSALKISA